MGAGDAVSLDDRLGRASRDRVIRAQEQRFLVREEAVEGRLRDVRELGEIDDAHGRVALLGDQLDHRLLQALALILFDQLRVEAMRSRR